MQDQKRLTTQVWFELIFWCNHKWKIFNWSVLFVKLRYLRIWYKYNLLVMFWMFKDIVQIMLGCKWAIKQLSMNISAVSCFVPAVRQFELLVYQEKPSDKSLKITKLMFKNSNFSDYSNISTLEHKHSSCLVRLKPY